MPKWLTRYLKFIGTSVIGTIVDTLVLWILSDFAFTKGYLGEYIISPILSFQAAVLVNFCISVIYVWKDRVSSSVGVRTILKLYLMYNASCSAVFLIRFGVMLLIEHFTGWDVVICNLLAMFLSGLANFLLNNNYIFKQRE